MTDQFDQPLNAYEQELLSAWEEIAKRGQLTVWIMLALKDGPKHMAHIKQFITSQTNNVITADDQSLYRALRRYTEAKLVSYKTTAGNGAADRKIYGLTETGRHVLQSFLRRNVQDLYYQPTIKELIERPYHESSEQ